MPKTISIGDVLILADNPARNGTAPLLVDESGALVVNGAGASVGSQLPYGADQQVVAYYEGTNNIETITYKIGGVTVKTRTFTYGNGGVANDDLLTGTVDA